MKPGKTILEAVMILRPLVKAFSLRRTAPRVATLALTGMLAALLALMALLLVFYTGYLALMSYGALTQLQALLSVTGIAILLIGVCVLAMRWQLQRMKPSLITSLEQVANTVDAFVDGLKHPTK